MTIEKRVVAAGVILRSCDSLLIVQAYSTYTMDRLFSFDQPSPDLGSLRPCSEPAPPLLLPAPSFHSPASPSPWFLSLFSLLYLRLSTLTNLAFPPSSLPPTIYATRRYGCRKTCEAHHGTVGRILQTDGGRTGCLDPHPTCLQSEQRGSAELDQEPVV